MKKNFKLPDTLVIMSAILLIMTILTWIIPPGEFDRIEKDGRTLVVPGTYQSSTFAGQTFFDLILSPIEGFIEAAQIIGFVLIIGGAFHIIQRTQSIQAGLQNTVRLAEKNPGRKIWIIPLLTLMFSLAGATFGMSEETLVFILITIPLARSLGYDTLVGVAIPFLGAGAGFAGAFSNPFTIGIAQAIAELPPFSGFAYRIILWVLMTSITIVFIMRYAIKVEKDPSYSPLFNDKNHNNNLDLDLENKVQLNAKRKIVLGIVVLGITLLIFGVTQLGWYINEIAGLFIVMAISCAIFYRLPANEAATSFVEGAKEMMPAALVIAFSRGILILAEEGKVIDTILFAISDSISGLPKYLAVEGMFAFQSILNFFIPSGSGQAALTMPIMTPLSDLLGVSRQTAVMAFQLGDGLSNMIIPTSGVTMGVLTVAKIPYQKWLKWCIPLVITLVIVGMLMLIPPVILFDWGPF